MTPDTHARPGADKLHGPWYVDVSRDGEVAVFDTKERKVAVIENTGDDNQTDDNAHAIAGLPALLARHAETVDFIRELAKYAGDARCWSQSGTFNIADRARRILDSEARP